MGCSPSKINNIETMNQYNERKTCLKQSISACNAFANAHFAYATALKNTGAALRDHAQDELQFNDDPSDHVLAHLPYDNLCPRSPATKKDVVWDFFSTLMEDHGRRLVEVGDKSNRVEIATIRKRVVENPTNSSSVRNVKLSQVFMKLDDGFVKASESAHQVLKLLEARKFHHHLNFAHNQGHMINHSTKVMRVITWNKSLEGQEIANVVKDSFTSKGKECLATLLDKMLAWEKKLNDQMKAGENTKFAYQKKVSSLDKLKKRDANADVLERTKAAASHMHTRYIVDLQFIDSTVSEINRLRDEQLYPKLVQLVKEMGAMWENMRKQHEHQLKMVQALQDIEISQLMTKGVLCECNLINTQLLQFHMMIWCREFEKLIQHEKIYIKSLKSWLRLNLASFDNLHKDKPSTKQTQNRKIETLLHTWQENLEIIKHREEKTKTAINRFACMINTMVEHQSQEVKLKKICDETRVEITKRSCEFEEWCDRQISKRRNKTDDMDVMDDMEAIVEQQMVTEALKRRLGEEEETYRRKCVEVKERSLRNMKDGLPEVFKAMHEFSCACSCMYGSLINSSVASS